MSLEFRIIRLGVFKSLAADLAQAHFAEASSYRKELKLDMDWGTYAQYDQAGLLSIVGVFDDNFIVGYSFVIKAPVLLHKQVTMGIVQFIYLKPDYRKGRNGVRLIKYSETVAKVMGCEYVTFSISQQQKRIYKLFALLGYKLREAVFSKKV